MDPTEYARLASLLKDNPNDKVGLAAIKRYTTSEPADVVALLEELAAATKDATMASQWYLKAARVCDSSLRDQPRMADFLARALAKDPASSQAATLLTKYYRAVSDFGTLASILEQRAVALSGRLLVDPRLTPRAIAAWNDVIQVCGDQGLKDRRRTLEACRRLLELDSTSLETLRLARSICWKEQQWGEVIALCQTERALISDPEESVAVIRQCAEATKNAGDAQGACRLLREARALDEGDFDVAEDLANIILQRIRGGEAVGPDEKREGHEIFVQLAEMLEGELALGHALSALGVAPGSDVAMRLAAQAAKPLGRGDEVASRWPAYLLANPTGKHAVSIRKALAQRYETAGQFSEALRVLEPLEGSNEPEIVARLDNLYRRAGRTDVLIARMERASQKLPRSKKLAARLDLARLLVESKRQNEAVAIFEQALELDPSHQEALTFAVSYRQSHGDYARARELLQAAVAAKSTDKNTRRRLLREIAALSEGPLRDLGDAIVALSQLCVLDKSDVSAREDLKRLLVKAERWDDYVGVLNHEAGGTSDPKERAAVLKRIAGIHELRREDFVAAAETYTRVAQETPEEDSSIVSAVRLYEKAGNVDFAVQYLSQNVARVRDDGLRLHLYRQLGEMLERAGRPLEAGEAFKNEAKLNRDAKAWHAAHRCFARATAWDLALDAIAQERAVTTDTAARVTLLMQEAEYLDAAGREEDATARVELAVAIAPDQEAAAIALEKRLATSGRHSKLVEFLLRRAALVEDKTLRSALRKRSVRIQAEQIHDLEAACRTLREMLRDADDAEAIASLADLEEQRSNPAEACSWLARLLPLVSDPEQKIKIALRRAALLPDTPAGIAGAIEACEEVLRDLDPKRISVLEEIASLEQRRGNLPGTVRALERALELVDEPEGKRSLWLRLADLQENSLQDLERAIPCLEAAVTPEGNLDVRRRLARLYRATSKWGPLKDMLLSLARLEPEDADRSRWTVQCAEVLEHKLGNVDGALSVLAEGASHGYVPCRDLCVTVGDRLGRLPQVAAWLLAWHGSAPASTARDEALAGAFHRFTTCGLYDEAGSVLLLLGSDPGLLADPQHYVALLKSLQSAERQAGGVRGFAQACERALARAEAAQHRLPLSQCLSALYLNDLPDPVRGIACLETVCALDSTDIESRRHLADLYELTSQGRKLADLLGTLAGLETEAAAASAWILKQAAVLERENQVDEALRALGAAADSGSASCRDALIRLADRQGRKGWAAQKLLQWHAEAPPSDERTQALKGAFERFLEGGQRTDAAAVLAKLAGDRPGPGGLLAKLEIAALEARDLEALHHSHELLLQALDASARARERVRQAEVRIRAGEEPARAVRSAEQGLSGLSLNEARPLLDRLAALTRSSADTVGLYERQVGRCAAGRDRMDALALAARVAAEQGALDRCRRLLSLAVGEATDNAALDRLESTAVEAEDPSGEPVLRRLFAEALASACHKPGDEGRTRAALLRRAALIAHRDLADPGLAWDWFGEAVFARVEAALEGRLIEIDQRLEELRTLVQALARTDKGVVQDTALEQKRGEVSATSAQSREAAEPVSPGAGARTQLVAPQELVIELFEAIYDLRFQRNVSDASDFVLKLLLERVGGSLGCVHTYDPIARQFVLVRVAGSAIKDLEGLRTPDSDLLLASARRRGFCLVPPGIPSRRWLQGERWVRLGQTQGAALGAAVQVEGRLLGAVEIAIAEGGYDEGSALALVYVAEQLAEVLRSWE